MHGLKGDSSNAQIKNLESVLGIVCTKVFSERCQFSSFAMNWDDVYGSIKQLESESDKLLKKIEALEVGAEKATICGSEFI